MKELPLTATVVTDRVKHGGELDGRRVIEVEDYYVYSVRGGWEACRHASVSVPFRLTLSELARLQRVTKTPAKTPQGAARRMWAFIRKRVAEEGAWLVDDDLPEDLRAGVNLMPLERAYAIHDAIALTRNPTLDAREFLARYGHLATRQPAPSDVTTRRDLELAGERPRRHTGPGTPPAPTDIVRRVGPKARDRSPR